MSPAIRAQGLRKRFGSVHALAGVDIEVPEGSVFGVLGPNGAGKTTLIRTLTTLLDPDEGEASVAGFDVRRQPREVQRRIGVTGQYAAVDEVLTGRENLRLIGRLSQLDRATVRRVADELLARFDLEHAADRQTKTYSGGMRRRLDLAASLIHRPRVLFLDEPTTGLDPTSRHLLWESIREQARQGTTILLSTQYLDEADRLVDRIVFIDQGEVVTEGTPEQLKRKVGGARVVLHLDSPEDARAAVEALSRAASLAEPPAASGATVNVQVTEILADVAAVSRVMDGEGLHVCDVVVERPSLDDVFMALAGRRETPGGQGGGG